MAFFSVLCESVCLFAVSDFLVFDCDFAVEFADFADGFKLSIHDGGCGDEGGTGGTEGDFFFALFDGVETHFFAFAFFAFFAFLFFAFLFFFCLFSGFALFFGFVIHHKVVGEFEDASVARNCFTHTPFFGKTKRENVRVIVKRGVKFARFCDAEHRRGIRRV